MGTCYQPARPQTPGTIDAAMKPPGPSSSQDALVAAALRGDRAAQGELVRRFQKPVLGLCSQLVGPREAEDLAQDSLTQVLSRLETFAGRSDLGTWVYRITTNICLTHLRRRKRSPFQSDFSPGSEPIGEPGGASSVQTGEDRGSVRRALENLPDEHRVILILRDVRGLEYEQLAEVLGIAPGTVRSRLFRARRALREALGPDLESR